MSKLNIPILFSVLSVSASYICVLSVSVSYISVLSLCLTPLNYLVSVLSNLKLNEENEDLLNEPKFISLT